MLGAYPLQKKEETPRFLLFSLIVRRYDLREVDGVSCRIFDIYPVASEHAVIEIQRLCARHRGDAHGGAVVFVHAVAIVAARARRLSSHSPTPLPRNVQPVALTQLPRPP